MSIFGVLDTGVNIKTIDDIIPEMVDAQKSAFGPAINTSSASKIGEQNSIVGDKVAELWELGEATYNSQYPDTAIGASLDYVAAFTGAERLEAKQSQASLRLNLATGTVLNVGRVVSRSATGDRFVTTAMAQNVSGAQALVAVAALSEQFGAVNGSAQTINTIETPVSGWTAKAAVVSASAETFALVNGQTLGIQVDGGATQTVLFVTGDFASIGAATAIEVSDAINANATGIECLDALGFLFMQSDTDGSASSIQVVGGTSNAVLGFPVTLVAGMNEADAIIGNDIETDIDFRIRREEEIRLPGSATVESMRVALLKVNNVSQAFVFENTSLFTDPSGIPGKAFEAVVFGGDDTEIAQMIFDQKPLGIESYRDPGAQGVTVPVVDTQGTTHSINLTRATSLQMFTEVDVTVDLALFGGGDSAAGVQQVKDAIALVGSTQSIGDDVIILKYQCIPLGIAGVIKVPSMKIENTFPPTNTADITILPRQVATFDTADMVVNVTSI